MNLFDLFALDAAYAEVGNRYRSGAEAAGYREIVGPAARVVVTGLPVSTFAVAVA